MDATRTAQYAFEHRKNKIERKILPAILTHKLDGDKIVKIVHIQ